MSNEIQGKKEKGKYTGLLIIIAIVAAFILLLLVVITSIPVYTQYTQGSRASEAQYGIGAIFDAAKMYYKDHNEDAGSIQQLIETEYLKLPEDLSEKWNFSLIGRNPIRQIEATSTDKMKGGAGHVILFDIQTGRFTGYGLASG